MYVKESLELLKDKIDIIEVISEHISLKRQGSTYKGLCPFHAEQTPSFLVKRGDNHYHCFGCGAHGDAIGFLMSYMNFSFTQAIEFLASKFEVAVEISDQESKDDRRLLKSTNKKIADFFHYSLFHVKEGKHALNYLYSRGFSPDSIQRFYLGYVIDNELFFSCMHKLKISNQLLSKLGLLSQSGKVCLLSNRLVFPIRDFLGGIVGFSARKIHETTFGGKYVNTSESALFKKSSTFFGFDMCRRRMAKERVAIIVEGQLDCIRLIEAGLNLVVAPLGTACGELHIKELEKIGISSVYLLMDADEAGKKASLKIGDLCQSAGMDVHIGNLPLGHDPDSFLSEKGIEGILTVLDQAEDYLMLLVQHLAKEYDLTAPAGKAEAIKVAVMQIQQWRSPVMVYETLKKLGSLMDVPHTMLGINEVSLPEYQKIKRHAFLNDKGKELQIDPNRILETDVIRWLIFSGNSENKIFFSTIIHYLKEEHFWVSECKELFIQCKTMLLNSQNIDLFSFAGFVNDLSVLDEIMNKKINLDKPDKGFIESLQKLIDRQWIKDREDVKMAIQSGRRSEEDTWKLVKRFDELRNSRCHVQMIEN
ncbi:DNA primase [Candidatus Clavichlamydia salmonicola]|uniref:DNA primase n=1 Tax=Candidatus Clavichlamydia salmonicola TaxID=469812 RepID=UPI001891DD0B|nr:DNA primase [Candidatus Clavichlamydia salmonicola]